MSETAPAYRARNEGEDLDPYAAELRAARGVVPAPSPAAPDEPDLYADWDPPDREALHRIQTRVASVLCEHLPRRDLDWIVEETLCQIRVALERNGTVRLPQIGTIEIVYSDHGPVGRFVPSKEVVPWPSQRNPKRDR